MPWWETGLRLLLAVTIGCVIGLDREHRHRPAGMRTHVLVCLGAATVAIMECLMAADTAALNAAAGVTGIAVSRGRLAAQVISGIGFLGAGTIFTSQKKVAGLTTAASLWNAACLGLACGFGYYGLAVTGCVIVMGVLTLLYRLLHTRTTKQLEIQFTKRAKTMAAIDEFFDSQGIRIADIDFHMENQNEVNVYTNLYTLIIPEKTTYTEVVRGLSEFSDIRSIHTINS